MNIGVALSGCDFGGVCSHKLLCILKKMGISNIKVAVNGTASPAALVHFSKIKSKQIYLQKYVEEYNTHNIDVAIANLSDSLVSSTREITDLSISAINIKDGKSIVFTNDFSLKTKTLCTAPINDAYDVLSASISPYDGLVNYNYKKFTLCNDCAHNGCPYYALKLMGCEKIISFAFLPETPKSLHDISFADAVDRSCKSANFHISLKFSHNTNISLVLDDYEEICEKTLNKYIDKIYLAIAK